MSPQPVRKAAGTRPAVPVRVTEIPFDWQCTWSLVEKRNDDGSVTRYWELKYINAACAAHSRLAAA